MATPCRACTCHLVLLVLVLACCILRHAAAHPRPLREAALLLEIKHAWGDPPALAAWSATAAASAADAHCRWPYVGCDSAGRVTRLVIVNTTVTGAIPNAVGRLSNLTHLDISNNNITGVFPTTLYRCNSLHYLDLSHNYISGKLPDDIGHGLGVNLRMLDLGVNMFNGTIPTSLSRLRNLRYLGLDNNRLTGTIPVELGELANLEMLWLADNMFDPGELPPSFKNLNKLIDLWAANCSLVGNFPGYLVEMSELETLDLSINSLTGSIPPGFWRLQNPGSFLRLLRHCRQPVSIV